ncbi:MAG TPA: hypothetical protein VJA26_10460 [Gammaproteobacteria bacterium]|nr:hypothetical protein [Gammaproteobacteria bacterium]
MDVDWDSLTTLEEWAGVLRELLEAASASVQSGDAARRTAAQKDLIEFVMQSPNTIAIELDELARGAIDDILLPAPDQALANIARHMTELAAYLPK